MAETTITAKALFEPYCSLPPAERALLLEAARKAAGK
jgi:hypothetical protein